MEVKKKENQPNMDFDRISFNFNHSRAKLHSNCDLVGGFKSFVCELEKETNLFFVLFC